MKQLRSKIEKSKKKGKKKRKTTKPWTLKVALSPSGVSLVFKIYSLSLYKVMTFKFLTQDGTKQCQLRVKYKMKTSWKVCTRCENVSLFSFSPY